MGIEFWLTAALVLAMVCVSGSAGYYAGWLAGKDEASESRW